MFRLIRPCLLAARSSLALSRPCQRQAVPLTVRDLPRRRFQHAVVGTTGPTLHTQRPNSASGRERQFGPQMRTEEFVMREFNGLLLLQEEHAASNTGRDGLIPGLYELLKSCSSPSLLETPQTKVAMAMNMMSLLKEKGFNMNASVYNTLLKIFVSLRHPFTPSEFLTEMKENGVDPNVGTLTYLIEAYCQQGNIAGAAKLLEHMKANDIAVVEDIYASLITGHAQNGDMDKAEGVLQLMKDKGHSPSNVTYQALLCAHAKHGNLEGIVKVREQMRQERVFASTMSVIRIIDTLSLCNHGHMISDVLELIRNKQWILEDLRSLSCTLLLRGEIDNAMVLVRCLGSYSAVTTFVGQAVVRGMALSGRPLNEILDVIGQFPSMSSRDGMIKMWVVYRDLLGLLYDEQLSQGEQRAHDIMTVAKVMNEMTFVDKSVFYPVLAHYSKTGDIEGTLDTLALMSNIHSKYDFYSMKFLVNTLSHANVSLEDFCKDNPRVDQVFNHLTVFFSESGDFEKLHQILCTTKSSESLNIGTILKGMSLAIRNGYRRGCLPALSSVYLDLYALEPRPSLEMSINITTSEMLRSAPKVEQDKLYPSFLAPLTKADLPVGHALNDLLMTLARRGQVQQLVNVYDEIKDLPDVQLSKEVQEYVSMVLANPKQFRAPVGDRSQYGQLKPLLPVDLASYNEKMSRGEMPNYMVVEELLLSLVKEDFETALKIRNDMVAHGYSLRMLVYNHFIEQYARLGDIKNMLVEVTSLRSSGLTPNVNTYNHLMMGYAEQGEPDEIRTLIGEVEQRGWPVNEHMVSYLMMAYVYKDCLAEAVQVISEFRSVVTPLGHALKLLFNELVKQGRPQDEIDPVIGVLHTLPRLKKSCVTDIQLEIYLQNGNLDTAREVVERDDFQLKPVSFVGHCRRWKSAGQNTLVWEAVGMLREKGVHRRNTDNALALLSVYRMMNNVDSARSLYKDLLDNGCRVDGRFIRVIKKMGIDIMTKNESSPPTETVTDNLN